jgi:hypothetical protein
MRRIKNMSRFVRRVGSNEPYRVSKPGRVAIKEVHLGNHKPNDYFTAVSHEWVPAQDLRVRR